MAESSSRATNLVTHEENHSGPSESEECRICLSNFGDLPIYGDDNSPDVSMEIKTFGAVQVDALDPYPKFICEDCFRLLESAISFRKLAKRSDRILKRRKWRRKRKKSGVKSDKCKPFKTKPGDGNICQTEPQNIDFVALPDDGVAEESYGEDDTVPLSQLVPNNVHIESVRLENVIFNNTTYDTNNIDDHGHRNVVYTIEVQDNTGFNNESQSNIDYINEFQGNEVFSNQTKNNEGYQIDNISEVTYHTDVPNNKATQNDSGNYEALDNEANDGTANDEELELVIPEDDNRELLRASDKQILENTENDENGNDNDAMMLIVANDKSKTASNNCKLCKMNFTSSEEYEEHRETIEHKKNYIMSFLPKKKPESAKKKETVYPKDRICNICNRVFTKLHYARHMNAQHKIKLDTARAGSKQECPICKQLLHPLALKRHILSKHSTDPTTLHKIKVECPVCNKMFSKDFLPLHMQKHKDETKNFICDQCGKKFFYKSTFYTHRLIHSNELPHKCDYCPYRGRTKGLLKTHVRTHTGDYPYQCTQCDTRCLTKSNLNAHLQRHRGPVDFICDTCNRGFYTKIQLERHIMVIHLGIKNHVCNLCGLAFGYRHGLMSHQLNVHKRAKRLGKARAVYLRLEEQGLLEQEPVQENIDVAVNPPEQMI